VPVFFDSTLAADRQGANFHGHAFTRIASGLGNVASVNILALGTIAEQTGIVRRDSLEQVIRKRFAGPAVDLNLKVLAAGTGLGAA
jgi:2-oxoglutarate ferredoxin oxidoreductase subunit gamma